MRSKHSNNNAWMYETNNMKGTFIEYFIFSATRSKNCRNAIKKPTDAEAATTKTNLLQQRLYRRTYPVLYRKNCSTAKLAERDGKPLFLNQKSRTWKKSTCRCSTTKRTTKSNQKVSTSSLKWSTEAIREKCKKKSRRTARHPTRAQSFTTVAGLKTVSWAKIPLTQSNWTSSIWPESDKRSKRTKLGRSFKIFLNHNSYWIYIRY